MCLIGARYQSEYESFFRDMKKLGRDKTCAFVKVRSDDPKVPIDKPAALAAAGFCASISTELVEQDMKALRRALTKEVVRMHEEQRAEDIPGYVELILKEVDKVARNRQRGVPEDYDKVIASLVRDMMRDESIHKDNFIEALATLAEKCEGFAMSKVDVPENVLQRQLPKLAKTQYSGKSSRVWHKLLSRYGKKNEETSE